MSRSKSNNIWEKVYVIHTHARGFAFCCDKGFAPSPSPNHQEKMEEIDKGIEGSLKMRKWTLTRMKIYRTLPVSRGRGSRTTKLNQQTNSVKTDESPAPLRMWAKELSLVAKE